MKPPQPRAVRLEDEDSCQFVKIQPKTKVKCISQLFRDGIFVIFKNLSSSTSQLKLHLCVIIYFWDFGYNHSYTFIYYDTNF